MDERRAALAAPADADGFVSQWRRVGGLRLHARERVPAAPTRTPCLLLHGLAVSHRCLMPTARRLTGRPVHVPDLAGFGLSDKPATVLDVAGHAELIARWWELVAGTNLAAGVRVAVLGNSFGCQVAVELARRRPDLVAALVLVGLPSLRVPTMLVRGARDPIAPQSWLDEAARLTPNSRLVVLEADHRTGAD